jgi:4'-phosphopantetheinyl transferase
MTGAQVDLWSCVATAALAEAWERALPDDLLREVRRRRSVERVRRIVQLALRRSVVAAYLGCSIDHVEMRIDERGVVLPTGRLSSTASHHDDVTIFAIARDVDLGVDIEPEFEADWEEALTAVLTSSELAALRSLPEAAQPNAYFGCWTRKEAVMKALGEGLSDRDPRTIEVSLPPAHPQLLALDGQEPREPWSIATVRPIAGYLASIAVRTPHPFELRTFHWPVDLPPLI